MEYRYLNAGEIVQEGDEVDGSVDGWRDEPVWIRVMASIGTAVPDPAYPSHLQYRRPIGD